MIWKSFIDGYRSVGGPDLVTLAGRIMGLISKAAIFTAVSVSVARCMGVPV